MSASSGERALPPLDLTGSALEVSVRWKKWIQSFDYYATGHDITDQGRLASLLLHFAGQDVQDLYDTLPALPAVAAGATARTELETTKGKLAAYFQHEPNQAFERHTFRRMVQVDGETVAQFVQRLRQQASYCSFADSNDALRDQLVEGVRDSSLRKKLLDKKGLTFNDTQTISRQHETTEASAKGMKQSTTTEVRRLVERTRPSPKPTPLPRKIECSNCGRQGHLAGDAHCKARSQACHNCGRQGHFSAKCRSASSEPKCGGQP